MDDALKLIEDQRLDELWAVYCSENDIRSEACLMLGWIIYNQLVREYNTCKSVELMIL